MNGELHPTKTACEACLCWFLMRVSHVYPPGWGVSLGRAELRCAVCPLKNPRLSNCRHDLAPPPPRPPPASFLLHPECDRCQKRKSSCNVFFGFVLATHALRAPHRYRYGEDSLGGFGDVENTASAGPGPGGGGARVAGLDMNAPSDADDVEVYNASTQSRW